MGYVIYQFGALVLPEYNAKNDVSTGKTATVFSNMTGGGVWDAIGTEQAKRRDTPLTKRCTFEAATAADTRTAYNALRAYNGKRDRLWRLWDDSSTEWCWARLVDVKAQRSTRTPNYQEVDLQFVMISPHWYGTHHGGGWLFDSGVYFDTGYVFDETNTTDLDTTPKTITVNNGGNRTVTNAAITITVPVGTTNITNLTIAISGISLFTYSGTIAAGTSLVIDCGAQSVVNNVTEDYAHFALHATDHLIDDWLRLEPGDNSVIITRTGGSGATAPTAGFAYYDGWE